MKYICFGEVLFDCLPTGPVLGGAPLNVSYHLSQLGNEGWVLSALGEDELGDRASAHDIHAFSEPGGRHQKAHYLQMSVLVHGA